jgi:hypothetical protein
MQYDWKFYTYPVEAQEVGEYLSTLSGKIKITPAVMVDLARDKKNVLHPCFEWRDEVAAEKWREQEARVILHNLVVTEVEDEQPTRAFLHYVKPEDEKEESKSYYVHLNEAREDEQIMQYILETALNEFLALKSKYAHLKKYLKPLFDAVEEVQLSVTV